MNQELLKQIIAESIYFGGLLAEQNYGGELTDPESAATRNALVKLQYLVQEFIAQQDSEEIKLEEILPLSKELEIVLKL